ncbi:MAG: endonuclease-3 [Rhodothermales bacterium]|jgi:endonuclease-3
MGRKAKASQVVRLLSDVIERPETELVHQNPFELLVAVILSAQCTDRRVNEISPDLFRAYPDVETLARASADEVFPLISSITFPNNKSRHLVGMASQVMERFGGAIPGTIAELQTLPGVGRKTAQVVAGAAFGVSSMPVDTHVFRVAHRLGLVRRTSATPDAVEQDLRRVMIPDVLSEAHHLFILHGRYTCTARNPGCGGCPLSGLCPQWEALSRMPSPREGLKPSRGRLWCGTRHHYVDHSVPREDRGGVRQEACPKCGSMNLFDSKTGRSLRRVHDVRIGDMAYGRPNDK